MSKTFRIARKPGQTAELPNNDVTSILPVKKERRTSKVSRLIIPPKRKAEVGPTTRKTIEVPEDYFYQVKMRALQRHILEKELWSEIVSEYFKNHPTV
jgi:hypothetical protein